MLAFLHVKQWAGLGPHCRLQVPRPSGAGVHRREKAHQTHRGPVAQQVLNQSGQLGLQVLRSALQLYHDRRLNASQQIGTQHCQSEPASRERKHQDWHHCQQREVGDGPSELVSQPGGVPGVHPEHVCHCRYLPQRFDLFLPLLDDCCHCSSPFIRLVFRPRESQPSKIFKK